VYIVLEVTSMILTSHYFAAHDL